LLPRTWACKVSEEFCKLFCRLPHKSSTDGQENLEVAAPRNHPKLPSRVMLCFSIHVCPATAARCNKVIELKDKREGFVFYKDFGFNCLKWFGNLMESNSCSNIFSFLEILALTVWN